MTTWPSGLRRVTRNHFSSGGVGSNPAVVVFLLPTFFLYYFYLSITSFPIKKWSHPDSNWGPENQNLICCPYTMRPLYHHFFLSISSLLFYIFFSFLYFFLYKKTPPVGLEPTTLRLKAARSTDWARKALTIPFFSYYSMFDFFFFYYYLLCLFICDDNVAEWSKACD